MKKHIVRAVLSLAFLLVLVLGPIQSGRWHLAWDSIVAIVFSAVVVRLTGKSLVFTTLVTFFFTVALPILVLGMVGEQVYDSFPASLRNAAWSIFLLNPLHGLLVLVPTAFSALTSFSCQRHVGSDNPSKPVPTLGAE